MRDGVLFLLGWALVLAGVLGLFSLTWFGVVLGLVAVIGGGVAISSGLEGTD